MSVCDWTNTENEWHRAYLSGQEVDLCDSSGVFVESSELHPRGPIAAKFESRSMDNHNTNAGLTLKESDKH